MDVEELYEKQYGENKLVNYISFPFLRKLFKKGDYTREDIAFEMIEKAEVCLDVGCGSGDFAFRLKDKCSKVYGVDISSSRIEEAIQTVSKKNFPENAMHFTACNIDENLDFQNDTFDVVTSLAVIEHVFDPYHVVNEICRVLKKGGAFVSEVPNIAYIRHRLHLLFGKLPVTSSPYNWSDIGWDGGHLHYFTQKTYCRLLEDCGFKVLQVSGSGLLAKYRNFWPSLLTGDLCVKAEKL